MTRPVFEPEARTIGSDRVLRESEAPSEAKVTSEVEIEDTSVLVWLHFVALVPVAAAATLATSFVRGRGSA